MRQIVLYSITKHSHEPVKWMAGQERSSLYHACHVGCCKNITREEILDSLMWKKLFCAGRILTRAGKQACVFRSPKRLCRVYEWPKQNSIFSWMVACKRPLSWAVPLRSRVVPSWQPIEHVTSFLCGLFLKQLQTQVSDQGCVFCLRENFLFAGGRGRCVKTSRP